MVTFRVSDMTCGHCASAIARAVASVDKDARLEISIPDKLVRVSSPAAESELVEAIADAGYTAEVVRAIPVSAPTRAGGCCCASRKSTAVDARQEASPPGASCCK
jgi:copper chaperone